MGADGIPLCYPIEEDTMRRKWMYGIYTLVVVLILGIVALLSGQEAVYRDQAQLALEKILDFAYGGLEYYGNDHTTGQEYAVFKDNCYSYQLDVKSSVLKSMIAHKLPQQKAITREMMIRLIGHAQKDRNGNLPVRLVDANGAEIVGDQLPESYFALYRERAFLSEGTCKEALARVEEGQISYLIAIQDDEELPMGRNSITRNQAVKTAFDKAQKMADRGELQNPRQGTPFWTTIITDKRIHMEDISLLTVTCALEIYDNMPYWKVTFSNIPVGKGLAVYSFYVDIFSGKLVE